MSILLIGDLSPGAYTSWREALTPHLPDGESLTSVSECADKGAIEIALAANPPWGMLTAVNANTGDIASAVLDHSLDVGCVEGPIAHPLIEVRPWRDDALVVCAPPDHPLAKKRSLKPEHFAGTRWVLREPGSATRATSERASASIAMASREYSAPRV